MTGFGQGEATDETHTVSVEIRTVNHRFLDYAFKLPRVLNARERDIKERIRATLTRGRIYVTISVESETADSKIEINEPVLEKYFVLLKKFAETHEVGGVIDINTLVQLPDAVVVKENDNDIQTLWPLAETALDAAVAQCHQMRVAEGKALEKDLVVRVNLLERTVGVIAGLVPGVTKHHAEAFRQRIEQLVGDASVDEDRLTTELALMADRLDVTEELTRLKSHIAQFSETIETGGEVSKKLTYLLQEVHREASTIGAKASDSEVIQHVVALKEETEKLREQVQNLE
jgi:uncharacterized protein (TIGR00255 family)